MSIHYDRQRGLLTLRTLHSAYQMKIDRFGYLLHLYYGPGCEGDLSYLLFFADRGFSGNPYDAGEDRTYSLDTLPQEYPVWGTGDYRTSALTVRDSIGSSDGDYRFESYEIRDGKYDLGELPSTYDDTNGAQTLIVTLRDARTQVRVQLCYGVFPECDVITRAAKIINDSQRPVTVTRALSASLDFVSGDYDLITFYGRHAMERNMQRVPVSHGIQAVGSNRGMSSHHYNPLVILAAHDATEDAGQCWAMEFVYSGSFCAGAERDACGNTRLQMGLSGDRFDYPLDPGETLTVPEVIMSWSGQGFSELSHHLHDCIRSHVVRGYWKDRPRPVLLNSWEAAYFDFDGDTIVELGREAAALGIELLVMDDGWFGHRSSDHGGLGDWNTNEKKLGCSLKMLSEKIHGLGLKFGIWIEPEMVSEDSAFYRAHPDYVMAVPGKKPIRGRSQLLLDFSRDEVADAVFDQMAASFDGAQIDYIKWDYNRSIAEIWSNIGSFCCSAANGRQGSPAPLSQGKVLYRYMIGVYRFMRKLLERYPDVLIEGCSGGGGRFDAGMLCFVPQIWCSDNTDAVDRLSIQYGTSFGYPPETMGAHVSVCPNEQNGRMTPFSTRALVASSGAFGYEMNPARLSEQEKAQVREQIALFHEEEALVRYGDYYRLTNPQSDEAAAWAHVAKDGSQVLVKIVRLQMHGNMTPVYIRLKGLDPHAFYQDEQTGAVFPGAALMSAGFPLAPGWGDYQGYRIRLRKMRSEYDERST